MPFLFIFIMLMCYTLQSLLCRKYADHYPGDPEMATPVFSIVSGLFVVVGTFAFGGFSFQAQWLTILLAVINAIVLYSYNNAMIVASRSGPYSVLMVFMMGGGIIIPTLIDLIAFHQPVSIGQVIAILFIFVAIYMISYKKEENSSKGSLGFYLACIFLFLTNGTYGALLNVQQNLTGEVEKDEMVVITYLGSFLISTGILLCKRGRAALRSFRQTKLSALFLVGCSIATVMAINLLTLLLTMIDVAILYTFDNAGTMLFSVLAACIFFREKLSKLNVLGCIIMCAALIGVATLKVQDVQAPWSWLFSAVFS